MRPFFLDRIFVLLRNPYCIVVFLLHGLFENNVNIDFPIHLSNFIVKFVCWRNVNIDYRCFSCLTESIKKTTINSAEIGKGLFDLADTREPNFICTYIYIYMCFHYVHLCIYFLCFYFQGLVCVRQLSDPRPGMYTLFVVLV